MFTVEPITGPAADFADKVLALVQAHTALAEAEGWDHRQHLQQHYNEAAQALYGTIFKPEPEGSEALLKRLGER
jgi:hypothetical protein